MTFRKVVLEEVDGGIVSRFEIAKDGSGKDSPYLKASLEGYQRRFGKPPELLAGDRGVSTPEDERLAEEAAGATRGA